MTGPHSSPAALWARVKPLLEAMSTTLTDTELEEAFNDEARVLTDPIETPADAIAKLDCALRSFDISERADGADAVAIRQVIDWLREGRGNQYADLHAEADRLMRWRDRLELEHHETDAEWTEWEEADDRFLRNVEKLSVSAANARIKAKAVSLIHLGDPRSLLKMMDQKTTDVRLAVQVVQCVLDAG